MKQIKLYPLFCFIYFFFQCNLKAETKNADYKYELAIALMFHNEAKWLKEWIEYYLLLGVDHFFLFNHVSNDNYQEILAPYIEENIVEVTDWNYPLDPNHPTQSLYDQYHMINYDMCVAALNKGLEHQVKWLAIIDADEFFVPITRKDLKDFLRCFDNDVISCVCARWVLFGTSEIKKIPPNTLLIESLLLNAKDELWFPSLGYKSIVRPQRVTISSLKETPHFFYDKKNYKRKILSLRQMQLNHYFVRDEDYLYNVKIPRWDIGRRTIMRKGISCEEWYIRWNSKANKWNQYSKPILYYVNALRKRMGFTN